MTAPAPWSDPDRDIAADMIETTAAWIASPAAPDERDVQTATGMTRAVFRVTDDSVTEARRRLGLVPGHTTHAHLHAPAVPDGDPRPRRRPDLTRRRPVHGGRVTHHDLNIDQDRIGADFEDLREQASNWPWPWPARTDDWTRDDAILYALVGDTAHRKASTHTGKWAWPAKRSGKADQLKRDLESWSVEYRRCTGKEPTVYRAGGRAHPITREQVYDPMAELAVLLEQDRRRHFWSTFDNEPRYALRRDRQEFEETFKRERQGHHVTYQALDEVIGELVDDLAERSDTPRDLLWPDGTSY